MVKFLSWLDQNRTMKGMTEVKTARKAEEIRIEGKDYVGPSFATIAAMGPHGAIIHYEPTEKTDVPITEGIYLLDSGGQYLMGTTDITRTVVLGEPTQEQKEMFTRVLKGHIGIATLRFPKGFSGKQLDAFARRSLWDAGKNYNHGTGHGIGHFLNVHEGPMGITPKDIGVPLAEGNVMSNEPGYYKEGEYGMRIENVIVVKRDDEFSTPEVPFLKFETITMCPIDLNLIDKMLLSKEEKKWLNDYHRMVYRKLSRKVDPAVKEWLRERTKRI
jgi:Xaa-Pro aminopeptidase